MMLSRGVGSLLRPERLCGLSAIRSFARQRRGSELPIPKRQKRLDVVIFGLPNVGKSVLLNCLIERKVAATTHKKHTTRGEILGFFEHRNTQLAFYDTPGYVTQGNALSHDMKALRNVGLRATSKADVILLCVNAEHTRLSGKQQDWFADMARVAFENAKTEVILVLNKVDLVEPKTLLLDTVEQLVSLVNGVKLGLDGAHNAQLDTTTFMISALKNDGVGDLKNYLLTLAKHKPHLEPVRSDLLQKQGMQIGQTPEQLVEEALLQVLLQQTHQEIPYIAYIKCTKIEVSDRRDHLQQSGAGGTIADDAIGNGNGISVHGLQIHVDIEVDTTKQQRMVIGQGGHTLVKIRQAACALLEKIFDVNAVFLRLQVSTRFDNAGRLARDSSLSD